ncbi:MBL fold metallo-hydrolase [Rhodococcus sp. SGAir0479]|uniref:MBL fold metallo-hydrolase n=1 Tax=Rhodococcus sp. SGAir0479 TaxID=2567884 RepID=UPI0010CCF40F|nr:MBL fold metallo-hydrolase [Rhodococcus sp. SGAir0479]QCQ90289.1 MBL fold metallo-hydrolase [Rhodococcus sp. SGAir0479]
MDLSLTFVGNATVLLRYGDLTLLTDPNFLHRGQHAYLGYGLVSARRHDPAIDVRDLPPLDAILLSHLHGDHWDRVAQRHLDRELPVLTTPHAAKRLRRKGFGRAVGLDTWQSYTLAAHDAQVVVTAMPGEHAPVIARRLLPPVMGSVLEFGPLGGPVERRLYISGDTLFVDALKEIPRRHPDLDAGVVHLGGTRLPAGDRLPFGLTVTMDGRQGADLVELLSLPKVVPVHFDDYTVFASPLSDFRDEATRRGFGDRIVYVDRGETVTL